MILVLYNLLMNQKIVAVIPAFNEYTKLSGVIEQTLKYVEEIIVIDDGSKRPLKDFLPSLPNLFTLRHKINLGKGAALKTGVEFAKMRKADFVVFIDADGQHNPSEIPSLIAPLADDNVDIVFGVRKFHEKMPLVARLGNIFLTQISQLLFRIKVSDTQSGFRAININIYPKIVWRSPRYAVETEMIVNAGKVKARFAEVPIQTIYHDKYRGTTVLDGIRIFFNMIYWKFL